jgi:predicted RNA-binding protein YlxR (DUF448 family)
VVGRNTDGPVRRCAVCRTPAVKRDLHRIVRAPDGTVRDDPGGKAPGRGVYLCGTPVCLEAARKRRTIPRALRVADVAAADRALEALAERLRSYGQIGRPG